jgi:hypothetical protein
VATVRTSAVSAPARYPGVRILKLHAGDRAGCLGGDLFRVNELFAAGAARLGAPDDVVTGIGPAVRT